MSGNPKDQGGADRLQEYRAKRRAGATPEPFGGPSAARPRLFVVQRHRATNLHYDLRLEWEGVLLSWAVPRGPSRDPDTKRLAMQTEDHPLEYADFEGVIPEGNYGAGEVIVWDQGCWIPREDPETGLEKGKLLFELRGHKLGGVWTLFRTGKKGGNPREWLLVKKPDAWARNPTEEPEEGWPESSVFSGLGVEELRHGSERPAQLRELLEARGAKKRRVDPAHLKPMLAQTSERIFTSDEWIYELKYDGFRLVCCRENGEARLLYRSGLDATHLYPEIARSVRLLPYRDLILDTEVCVLDEEGRPEFQLLQQRAQLQRRPDIERGTVERPVVCYAFDLLAAEGYDVRGLPLLDRKKILQTVLPEAGVLRYADHVETEGEAFYEQVQALGLEGILAKKASAPYRGGRSSSWLKLKADRTGDFVICGFTEPKGSRTALGALHLAAYDGGELVYAGRVGTGFRDRQLRDLRLRLEPLLREKPPCSGPVPRTRGHAWVDPTLVCEVRYRERTADGLLRHPSFVRLRDDKRPEECEVPPRRGEAREISAHQPAPGDEPDAEEPALTNLTKVFWPAEGYTKKDLIDFYRDIAPAVLPYLQDRPVVLTRYPDGIDGKSFFQKDAPSWVPDWIRTERIWSEQTEREIDYFICDDARSLVFLANLGTIPLHVWSSRVTDLSRPDWCVLDLDPKGAPFTDVVTVAQAIHALCEDVELPHFVKSSGSTGLHVLVPMAGQFTYEQCRTLGEVIARIVEARLPEIATTARVVRNREGKVYIDFLQNGHGRLIAAPYSVRPLPGAPVSAPLRWNEVTKSLDIARHTIRTVPGRVKRMKEDPLRGVLDAQPDLPAVLERLAGQL